MSRLRWLAALLVVVGGIAVPGLPAAAAVTLPSGFDEVSLASGFSTPTASAWAPDGRMFVAEKAGKVRVVTAAGTLVSTPLLNISAAVNHYSDRGLLGIATDKDFASNGWLYLLYVRELRPDAPDTDTPSTSRLTRITVNPDNTVANPSSPETVILGTVGDAPCPVPPNNAVDCIPADYKWHTIGTVRSDPVDGTLWVGSGDTHPHLVDATSYRPFDESSYAGKILHVDRNGNGLPGHPFCPADNDLTHVCTKVYAKGFRNPFRFHLRPGKGPVVGDVGHGQQEEVDLIQPGKNYGWPCYEGTVHDPVYTAQPTCVDLYSKEGTPDGATFPSWSYPHGDGASVTVGPVYTGSVYPAEYQGDIFVGDYVQGWIKRLEIGIGDVVTGVQPFATEVQGNVSLDLHPENGDLTYVDIGYPVAPAAVRRFRYFAGNAPPVPRPTADPRSGPAPLLVQFTGSTSSDPDNDPLTYDWDFGDGSPHSTAPDPTHTYAADGSYTARLTVDDGTGRNPSATVVISVGSNLAPMASIDSPAPGALYRGGEEVVVAGSATDPEDGPLSGAALTWEVLLHHATHIHPFATLVGSSGSFVPAVDHDADSYYELRLTATDSSGESHTAVRRIDPQTVPLAFESSPPGALLTYGDDAARAAPFTRTAAIGTLSTLAAAQLHTFGGESYVFSGWSDGGERQHSYTVPPAGTTLTATYSLAGATTLPVSPVADTYVDAETPTSGKGGSSGLVVDGAPVRESYLRFNVAGLGGRQVLGVRLRLYQTGDGPTGGTVRGMSSTTWPESTTTYDSRPAADGPVRGTFGPVVANRWYELALDPATVTADGALSLALTTTNADGVRWGSRESATKPQLLVDVATGTQPANLSTVAGPTAGSADPTAFAGNRRVAVTQGGRHLVVHGRAGGGAILRWRDGAGPWRNATTGAVPDGIISANSPSVETVASIAVVRDPIGAEHAWVVWSAAKSTSSKRPLRLLRLTNLDALAGPTVGAAVTVDAPAGGTFKPDIAFERAPDGTMRGVVVYGRKITSSSYDIAVAWFTDLTTNTPSFTGQTVLSNSASSARHGSLVPTPTGMRVVARSTNGTLRVHAHGSAAALTSWTVSASGGSVGSAAVPTGIGLDSGSMLSAVERDTAAHVVRVTRWSATGTTVVTDLELTGYAQPALASDGTRTWLVLVRQSDGLVVSRVHTPTTGWSTADVVEVAPVAGGNHAWPNPLRAVAGELVLVVRGPAGGSGAASVLHHHRAV